MTLAPRLTLTDTVVCGGLAAERGMERRRQKQAGDAQSEQAGAHLGDGAIVALFSKPETAEEKAHAQDQKQADQNGAKRRCLDDADVVFDDGDAGSLSVD